MSYFTTRGSIKRPLFPTDAVANVFQAEGVHSIFTLQTRERGSNKALEMHIPPTVTL